MPIAEKQSAFLFSSASEVIVPYGGLSSNGKLSAVCSCLNVRAPSRVFYPPINERECSFMQFLTHIIFLLNLLKTLINHFS
jgi:hypothetical protein